MSLLSRSLALLVPCAVVLVAGEVAIAQTQETNRQPTTWSRIRELFGQRERKGGSKGAFCPLSPSAFGHRNEVWSQSPLLAWRGAIERVEVRSEDGASVLWRWEGTQEVAGEAVAFGGEPLQPGETYDLWFFLPVASLSGTAADGPSAAVTFSVLPAEERQQVGQRLARLTQHYEGFGIGGEALVRYRAGFFAERGLWADAMEEMVGVEEPSGTLVEALAGLERDVCDGVDEAIGF